jgi:DAK2 domain fusion protein YloV
MSLDPQIVLNREAFLSKPLDGQVFKELIEAGLTWLRTNQKLVNSLNVFPVPDGDTGTNMVLTMQSAFNEISTTQERNVGSVAHSLANGALMGARGNSGVILSQLLRGLARSLDHLPVLDVPSLVQAFAMARDTAYKGVVRPVEGTILTVAKDIAAAIEGAEESTTNLVDVLEMIVKAADQSVTRTPDLLPVLKEAGVVDAGGKGLFFILEGMLRSIDRLPLDVAQAVVQPLSALKFSNVREAIEPGQDFEIVIDFRPQKALDLAGFYSRLEELGTSIQLGEGDGLYRMHIHVPTPNRYKPIDYVMGLGIVTKVAIENLVDQMSDEEDPCQPGHYSITPVQPGQIGVIAVSPGAGIARVFAGLGAAAIVDGGQTMNPSTQEIVHAFEDLPTDKIIILPNNKNIIMSAKMAAGVSVKKVAVIPSRSIPQGLAAILKLAPEGDFEQVIDDMNSALGEVQTGEITTATRDAEIDGIIVKEGQLIALHNGKLICACSTIEDACLSLLEEVDFNQYELITLFYGKNITIDEVNQIAELIRSTYPSQEIEIQEGCQPHYQFIMSIE